MRYGTVSTCRTTMRSIAPLAALALAATQTAVSAQTMTVESPLDNGYTRADIATAYGSFCLDASLLDNRAPLL